VNAFSSWSAAFAVTWLLVESGLTTTLFALLVIIPSAFMFAFGGVGGRYVDQSGTGAGTLLSWCFLIQGTASTIAAALVAAGHPVSGAFIVLAVIGSTGLVEKPAMTAFVASMPTRHVDGATGSTGAAVALARVAAIIIAGVVLGTVGAAVVFLADATMSAVTAYWVRQQTSSQRTVTTDTDTSNTDIVFAAGRYRTMIGAYICGYGALLAAQMILVAVADGNGAAVAVGEVCLWVPGAAAAIWVARTTPSAHIVGIACGTVAAGCVTLAVYATSSNPATGIIGFALCGAGGIGVISSYNRWTVAVTDPSAHGRIGALTGRITGALVIAVVVGGGIAIDVAGATVVAVAAAIAAAGGVWLTSREHTSSRTAHNPACVTV
jgi:hypothetical protein